jgi:hypothetical protein
MVSNQANFQKWGNTDYGHTALASLTTGSTQTVVTGNAACIAAVQAAIGGPLVLAGLLTDDFNNTEPAALAAKQFTVQSAEGAHPEALVITYSAAAASSSGSPGSRGLLLGVM